MPTTCTYIFIFAVLSLSSYFKIPRSLIILGSLSLATTGHRKACSIRRTWVCSCILRRSHCHVLRRSHRHVLRRSRCHVLRRSHCHVLRRSPCHVLRRSHRHVLRRSHR